MSIDCLLSSLLHSHLLFTHISCSLTLVQVALANSKAKEWHQRYLELASAAKAAEDERVRLEGRLSELQSQGQQWREDKDMLHKGYQEQLTLLNDHLLRQGELIALKDNELSVLQAHRVKCVTCGGWNTISWLVTHGNNGKVSFVSSLFRLLTLHRPASTATTCPGSTTQNKSKESIERERVVLTWRVSRYI